MHWSINGLLIAYKGRETTVAVVLAVIGDKSEYNDYAMNSRWRQFILDLSISSQQHARPGLSPSP